MVRIFEQTKGESWNDFQDRINQDLEDKGLDLLGPMTILGVDSHGITLALACKHKKGLLEL